MREDWLSYLIAAVAFLPILLAATAYTLVFLFSCYSIAIHSIGAARERKDEANRKEASCITGRTMTNVIASTNKIDPNDTGDFFARLGLVQTDVILHICCFLTPLSVTRLACVNQATRKLIDDNEKKLSHPLWRNLWYRDYGRVLFEWEIAREAIFQSLMKAEDGSTKMSTSSSTSIGGLVGNALENRNTKEFYFRFQLAFVDYVLAGHNQKTKCLMGLHGHIFDFTQFAPSHPGLSEPIVRECGRDITEYFEDIQHSKGARRIACKLCVVLDRSRFQPSNNDFPCGLYSPSRDFSNLQSVLRQTNTRPPPAQAKMEGCLLQEEVILPMRGTTNSIGQGQHLRTLQTFGRRHALARHFLLAKNSSRLSEYPIHPYYDPFLGKWKGWYQDRNWNTFHVDFDT
eukprot:scaffold2202_cov87-Cylindrotheca_fusiformis.AAC.1